MKPRCAHPRCLTLIGIALLLSVVPSVSAARDKAPPVLSGTWKLNEQKSESLQDEMDKDGPPHMMGGGPMMGGGMGGMGGGMGGPPPGMHGGPGAEGESDPMRDPVMAALARPPLMMVIEQSDASVVVSERGRTLRTILLHHEEPDPDAHAFAQMQGHWKGDRLEGKGESADGRKLVETYRLSKDKQSLTVVVKGQGPGGRSIELERVYDRAQGEPQ